MPASNTGFRSHATLTHSMAFARSVNLRAQDLPGATTVGEEAKTEPSAVAAALMRCGGALPGWEAGSIHSPNFVDHATGNIVSSAVRTVASASVAQSGLAADLNPRVRRCLSNALRTLGPAGSLANKHFTVSPAEIRLSDISMSGIRIAITVVDLPNARQGSSRTTRLDQDILGFVSGAHEIALTDTYSVGDLFAPAIERKLVRRLYTRAAHVARSLD